MFKSFWNQFSRRLIEDTIDKSSSDDKTVPLFVKSSKDLLQFSLGIVLWAQHPYEGVKAEDETTILYDLSFLHE